MRISAVAFFMILTTVFLSGCGRDEMASLDDHHDNFYGKNGVFSLSATMSSTQMAAPVEGISVSSNKSPFGPPSKPLEGAVASNSWQWPVNGKVVETFGKKENGVSNEGIVIAANEGVPIAAAQAGEVAFVGDDAKNYGKIVILRHADGDMTSYAHAQSIVVKKGDRVNRGTTLGYVGKTGNAKEPQLHFAVREGNHGIDPLTKLPQQVATN